MALAWLGYGPRVDTSRVLDPADVAKGPLSALVLPHILALYRCEPQPDTFDVYAMHAEFEDPITHCKGAKEIRSGFTAMSKIFWGVVSECSVGEDARDSRNGIVTLDMRPTFVVRYVGLAVTIPTLTVLTIADGKIVHHEDRWSRVPMPKEGRGTLLGYAFETARRAVSYSMHVTMRLLRK
eukprot:jgi/Chlat1/2049/Chrsp17S02517